MQIEANKMYNSNQITGGDVCKIKYLFSNGVSGEISIIEESKVYFYILAGVKSHQYDSLADGVYDILC